MIMNAISEERLVVLAGEEDEGEAKGHRVAFYEQWSARYIFQIRQCCLTLARMVCPQAPLSRLPLIKVPWEVLPLP